MKDEAPYLTTNDSRLVDIFTGRRIQITSDSETNDLTKKSDTFNVIQLHSIPTEGVSIQDAIFDTCRHYLPSQNIIITEIPDIIVVDTNQPCNKLLFASLFQIRVDGILGPNPFHDADQSDKPRIHQMIHNITHCMPSAYIGGPDRADITLPSHIPPSMKSGLYMMLRMLQLRPIVSFSVSIYRRGGFQSFSSTINKQSLGNAVLNQE